LLITTMLWTSPVCIASADEPAAEVANATRTIDVHLVKASKGEASIDPALKGVASDLRSLPFNRFERVGGATWKTDAGQDAHVEQLGAGVEIRARLVRTDGDRAEVELHLTRNGEQVAHTTVKRHLGSASPISVGRQGGNTWVVMVRVLR
jgi:hypothetical protein